MWLYVYCMFFHPKHAEIVHVARKQEGRQVEALRDPIRESPVLTADSLRDSTGFRILHVSRHLARSLSASGGIARCMRGGRKKRHQQHNFLDLFSWLAVTHTVFLAPILYGAHFLFGFRTTRLWIRPWFDDIPSASPASTAIDLPSRSMQRKRRSKFKVSTPRRSFQFQLVGGIIGEMQKVVGSHLQHHPQSRRAVHLLQFFAEYL